jgi:hypothetical protein
MRAGRPYAGKTRDLLAIGADGELQWLLLFMTTPATMACGDGPGELTMPLQFQRANGQRHDDGSKHGARDGMELVDGAG